MTTKNTSRKRKTTRKYNTSSKKKNQKQEQELWYEVGFIVLLSFMAFLFLCNFGIVGAVGVFFKNIMFGLFGLAAYILPVFMFVGILFYWVNGGSSAARRKLIAGAVLFLLLSAVGEFLAGRLKEIDKYHIDTFYKNSVEFFDGGGVLGGSIAYCLYSLVDTWGSILVLLVAGIICMVLITEKSFIKGVANTTHAVVDRTRSNARDMREYASERAKTRELERYEQLRLKQEQLSGREQAGPAVPDRNKTVKGVNFHSIFPKLEGKEKETETVSPVVDKVQEDHIAALAKEAVATAATSAVINQVSRETMLKSLPETDELHELRPKTSYHSQERLGFTPLEAPKRDALHKESAYYEQAASVEETIKTAQPAPEYEPERDAVELTYSSGGSQIKMVEAPKTDTRPVARPADKSLVPKQPTAPQKPYMFPPISLLQKGKSVNPRDGQKHLEETARRLQDCLRTFGVNVTITDISQGPAVTRYELQPEQGVKVSRIVNLSDDIKLNLAATDIRIEAPIPGKSAIGIEVPNKENSAVAFRELIESNEFSSFSSKIAFAVGKDIAGKIVVADIAKMPHMLIAGATGSGKSVCINTLIMSILYKATPDEVKLIMIDPKVVELSSYNGIPHLLIPVVTDPKQAAGALQWGVSEMMARYEKFAEYNVRDMKGFNAKIDDLAAKGQTDLPGKLPQIVIIVDELADLMMVAPGEVEESICRLAQLARAAGIHLIIATQRPSVDVITGLIKANMPSRVAFAVSSGVDSRTILDMNGAEKLLGKGDMLFYPQGYSKPVRVQGSFVSDAEVGAVVDYLKNQQIGNVYQEDIQNQINSLKSGGGAGTGGAGAHKDNRDELFEDAARFIIEKDKASIGMLQRVFKIGFNRAARIVDQLCEYGVVGEEEGTKPRKVLMSLEQFETLMEEI